MESPSTEIQEAVALESSELLSWYRKMVEIRLAEDKIMEIYMRGLVPGTVHLAQGQEGSLLGRMRLSILTTGSSVPIGAITTRWHEVLGLKVSSRKSWVKLAVYAMEWVAPVTWLMLHWGCSHNQQ